MAVIELPTEAIEVATNVASVSAETGTEVPDQPVVGPREGRSQCADLEAQICRLAGDLAAAECRWLLLVAAYDAAEGWRGWECRSCAHWLSWKCGLGLRAAEEKVRVARRLAELPVVAAAFGRGELSYTKVRALARMCTPETEADLVEMARWATGAQLERLSAGYARATRDRSEREATWVRSYADEDGHLVVNARLTPDDGAWLLAALDSRVEAADRGDDQAVAGQADRGDGEDSGDRSAERDDGRHDPDVRSAERPQRRPIEARRADALAELVADAGTPDGESSDEDRASEPPTPELVVIAEEQALHEHPAPGECRIEGGPAIRPEVARRLACDCDRSALLKGADGHILDGGHTSRTPNRATRHAVHHRDDGCRFPGCGQTRRVHVHHIVHWAEHGPTRLDNLILLCSRHHRAVHEGGYGITGDPQTGPVTFADPDGHTVHTGQAPVPATTPEAVRGHNLAHLRHRIDENTITSLWDGQRLDLAYAVSCILDTQAFHRHRAPAARSAERSSPGHHPEVAIGRSAERSATVRAPGPGPG